ncbi:MAG: hypothetical protein ABS75_07995 [Pelagibacterium sp. SCN 63-23]|nr:MAG: hypothetical protein ABS75_07995 [Pelagibacterium sp. SCN 63-23]
MRQAHEVDSRAKKLISAIFVNLATSFVNLRGRNTYFGAHLVDVLTLQVVTLRNQVDSFGLLVVILGRQVDKMLRQVGTM